jgi:ADP-glucose pyrophosphorylase
MVPFGGRYRIVDFTIRNSTASGAARTIIYSNFDDDLPAYVENYGPFAGKNFPSIKVVSREYSDITFCYNLIMGSNTAYYIIYNGDNPSMIDFTSLIERYKKKKAGAVLFTLHFANRESMAYTILVASQKMLLQVVKEAMNDERHAPNIFEMIINIMINRGIKKETAKALYWPLKNIPDYYMYNMKLMKSRDIFSSIFHDPSMKSHIRCAGHSTIGRYARVENSFISDSCIIDGSVSNSIIFPCVEIGEKAVVRDSIVLPFNKIGPGTRVTKTIVDERTAKPKAEGEPEWPGIGGKCYIGSEHEQLKNSDFPRNLSRSITLIGKNCVIPEGSHIGGACYIASGKGEEFFSRSKYLYDGLSLVK